MVVFRCQECDAPVSRLVTKLTDESLLRKPESFQQSAELGAGEPDFLPEEFYLEGLEDSPIPETDGWPLLNPEDMIETTLDMDVYCGCCGPDGSQGPNTECRNGHKVGIERGDCWTVHCVALDPDSVVATDAEGTGLTGLDGNSPR